MTAFDKLKKVLEGEVGYRESGTNHQKYSPAVPGLEWSQNQPWCATFDAWGYLKAGLRPDVDFPVTASCLEGVAWYKKKKRWGTTPKLGSQVFYGPGGGTHVEIVIAVSGSHITTIGGNTSGSLGGTYFNGDGVYKKTVARSNSRIYGYGTPFNLDQEEDMPLSKDDIEKVARETVKEFLSAKYNRRGHTVGLALETTRDGVTALLARNPVDLDEEAVAKAILQDLTPERIAAAIPSNVAKEVADEITRRMAE